MEKQQSERERNLKTRDAEKHRKARDTERERKKKERNRDGIREKDTDRKKKRHRNALRPSINEQRGRGGNRRNDGSDV